MFLVAYAVARFLWIPLLACWVAAKGASGRGAMALPIVAGVLATIWELMIPASANIRIDIMLVGPVLMLADGLGGLLLAGSAYHQRSKPAGRAALMAAAAMCLGACAFFALAWTFSMKQADDQYAEHVEGSRYYFEAAFRDDATQRETFGNLEGTRWAGYYAADPPQPSFMHLVVNDHGDWFLYTQDFYERHGRAAPDPADPAVLAGNTIYLGINTGGKFQLRDLGDGRVQLRWQEGGVNEVAMARRAPPRFPRPPSASDKVAFVGVFSGRYEENRKYTGVAQVWIWKSEARMWAVWLRGSFLRQNAQPVFVNSGANVRCEDKPCETIHLATEGRGVTLHWDTADQLSWKERDDRTVLLKRGEVIEGLPWARAPLATVDENRKWLRALHPDIAWKAP